MANSLIYLKDVVTLSLDTSKCTGCGKCMDVCPRAVLSLTKGTAAITNRDACIECGACSLNCPFQALTVDAGVGCAYAIIRGALTGTEPTCGCSDDSGCC